MSNLTKNIMTNSVKNVAKSTVNGLKVVNKAPKVVTPKAPKVVTPKAPKVELHKAMLECNANDKKEIYSLSGALARFKKQMDLHPTYKGINPIFIIEAIKYDTILKHVSQRCVNNQKFSPFAVGSAINRYLKIALK